MAGATEETVMVTPTALQLACPNWTPAEISAAEAHEVPKQVPTAVWLFGERRSASVRTLFREGSRTSWRYGRGRGGRWHRSPRRGWHPGSRRERRWGAAGGYES